MRDFVTTASSFAGIPQEAQLPFDYDSINQDLIRDELYQNVKKKLFKVGGKQKKGDSVSMSPQVLKDLYRLVMLELKPNERSQIAIYELQTFIIEQCIKPKEVWESMNFEVFLTFLINWIRLEPDLWIKSSEQYKNITATLKEKFGENMGAEHTLGKPNAKDIEEPPMNLDDQRVLKQNQNAIENYKKYIDLVESIKDQ